MAFEIKPLADCPQAIPLLALWHFGQWGHLSEDDSIEGRATRLMAQLRHEGLPRTWVALMDGVPVGSAALVQHDLPGREDLSPWAASVYVHSGYRGRGAASLLMQCVVAEAGAMGFERLYLFTWDQEKLYAKLGWAVHERTTCGGDPVVIMTIQP